MKNEFNPEDWLSKPAGSDQYSVSSGENFTPSPHHPLVPPSSGCPSPVSGFPSPDLHDEVDTIVSRIEAALTDITTNYADWVNVGFAFAHEFGEAGRSFFQRVSRFYPNFTLSECNKQYDQCLKSQGQGITISTFFYLAREAGIEVKGRGRERTRARGSEPGSDGSTAYPSIPPSFPTQRINNPSDGSITPPPPLSSSPPLALAPPPEMSLPTLPDLIFPTLPKFFQQVVAKAFTKEERDILLLGSMVTLSACLHRVFGIYDGRKVYPNLYIFISAMASAGKGNLVFCKRLVNLIHWKKRDQAHAEKQKYEVEMREYNLLKSKDMSIEKPEKPPELLLFIPANSSSTGVFQLLSDNDGRGLIFETEGDTLAQAFKTDYGNYSDGFRKAFHHETINYYRRTDREYVEIQSPCISAMLSGTNQQIQALIPSAEDGLLSRFINYRMNLKPEWKNVFAAGNDSCLEQHFNELGREFYSLYKALDEHPELQFCFTPCQEEAFNQFFTQLQDKYLALQGVEYMATVRRLGLIAFRMAMIFSALRILESGDFSPRMECCDEDFHAVLEMTKVLVRHASYVFSELPENDKQARPKNKKELFLEALPERFTHQEFVELANRLSISKRTAEHYITNFCARLLIARDQKGMYTNLTYSSNSDANDPS